MGHEIVGNLCRIFGIVDLTSKEREFTFGTWPQNSLGPEPLLDGGILKSPASPKSGCSWRALSSS